MKKTFLIKVLLLLIPWCNSQEKINLDASILTFEKSDTIHFKIAISKENYQSNLLDDIIMANSTIEGSKNGKSVTFSQSNIHTLIIQDSLGAFNVQTYKNARVVLADVYEELRPFSDNQILLQEITKGKISWYKNYYPQPLPFDTIIQDWFIKDRILLTGGDYGALNSKQIFLVLFADNKDILNNFRNHKYHTSKILLDLINKYNNKHQ